MSDYQIVDTIPDFKITLYKRDISPNMYYYFTYGKRSVRGSTGSYDIHESKKISMMKYYEVMEHKGKKKIVKFDNCVKKFLKYKESRVSPRTLSDYIRHSKYLLERFKNKDI